VGAVGKRGYKIREKISNVFELPEDIVLDVSKVIIVGTNQVTIENHKGIIEYSEELIRVNTGNGIMSIYGRNLIIKHIFQEEITIVGEIQSINY
jgi:sporulation protein YqfC